MKTNLIKIISILSIVFATITSTLFAAGGDKEIPDQALLVKFGAQLWKHDNKDYLVVNYKNYPHWHTYWKNPGDAGLPLKNEFKINNNSTSLTELEWPAPKLYVEEGGIIAFGYGDEYSLFYELPSTIGNDPTPFELKAEWLICKHVCIPGTKTLSGTISRSNLQVNSEISIDTNQVKKRFTNLPQEYTGDDIDLVLTKNPKEENALILFYQFNSQTGSTKLGDHFLITPFLTEPFDFLKEQLTNEGKTLFGKMPISWDGEYMEPVEPLPANGVFSSPKELKFLFFHPDLKKSFVLKKTFDKFILDGAAKFNSFFGSVNQTEKKDFSHDSDSQNQSTVKKNESEETSLLAILLFAFLGGLILNVMPCVLPVISIKLFGLIKTSQESKKEIFKHNMFYSLGVLVSFWVLAAVILILKNSGESLGWGFQLQSPTFVFIVIIILFVFAINLFGLFEFRLPGASKLGGIQLKEGAPADFFNGILATILSTPCSAPFLGAALTYAFTAESYVTVIVFTFMALGLAFPFLVIAFFPNTIKWLPKPGMWMDHLKKFLGLALLLTIVWLFDVFSALVEYSGTILWFNTTLVLLFFWIYFTNKIAKKNAWKFIFLIPVFFFFFKTIQTFPGPESSSMVSSTGKTSAHGLEWDSWSREKMKEYQGQYVFMDFTAKWCFTCKVNEKLVINTDSFREVIKEKKMKLLLGDWTKKDPRITEFLKENGLVGVPAYFVLKPNGELVNLGETITVKKFKNSL